MPTEIKIYNMSGAAGLPVTAEGKVMSKLEPPNAAESAFEFMRATGVFPTRNGDKWSISYLHAGGFFWHTLRQIDWSSLAFDTPLEAVQAAMKALEDLKPAWPEYANRESKVGFCDKYRFIAETGIYPYKLDDSSWSLTWLEYSSIQNSKTLEEYFQKNDGSNLFPTAFAAIQAAMKLLKWGEQ